MLMPNQGILFGLKGQVLRQNHVLALQHWLLPEPGHSIYGNGVGIEAKPGTGLATLVLVPLGVQMRGSFVRI